MISKCISIAQQSPLDSRLIEPMTLLYFSIWNSRGISDPIEGSHWSFCFLLPNLPSLSLLTSVISYTI